MKKLSVTVVVLALLTLITSSGMASNYCNCTEEWSEFDAELNGSQTVLFKPHHPNEVVEYKWYFGDGKSYTTSRSTVRHTYERGGNYKVTLEATNSCGNVTKTTRKVEVPQEETCCETYREPCCRSKVRMDICNGCPQAIAGIVFLLFLANLG